MLNLRRKNLIFLIFYLKIYHLLCKFPCISQCFHDKDSSRFRFLSSDQRYDSHHSQVSGTLLPPALLYYHPLDRTCRVQPCQSDPNFKRKKETILDCDHQPDNAQCNTSGIYNSVFLIMLQKGYIKKRQTGDAAPLGNILPVNSDHPGLDFAPNPCVECTFHVWLCPFYLEGVSLDARTHAIPVSVQWRHL